MRLYSVESFIPLFAFSATVASQGCMNFGFGPQLSCNSDPAAIEFLETYMVDDHGSPGCSDGGEFNAVAQFIDLNGVTSTVTAISPTSVASDFVGTMAFSYNIPLSTIRDRSPVTITITGTNADTEATASAVVSYVQTHVPTIVNTVSTSTETTTSTTSTREIVVTAKKVSTSTFVPASQSTVTVKGRSLTILDRSTTTKLVTITLAPATSTRKAKAKTTVTVSCTSASHLSPRNLPGRKRDAPLFSVPYCGLPKTTTSYTSTSTSTITKATTDSTYRLTTLTSVHTVTASAVTTYINVLRTITSTPLLSTFTLSVLPASRVTSFVDITVTATFTTYIGGDKFGDCRAPVTAGNARITGGSPAALELAQATSAIVSAHLVPWCSTYIGWLTPVATETSTISKLVTAKTIVRASATVVPRNLVEDLNSRSNVEGLAKVAGRDIPLPAALTAFPVDIVSAACSLKAHSPTITKTKTVKFTLTTTVATLTSTVTGVAK